MGRKGEDWELVRNLIVFIVVLGVMMMVMIEHIISSLHADDGHVSGVPHAPKVPVAVVWPGPDRMIVALRDDRALVVVNPETREIGKRFALGYEPNSLMMGPDGSMLVGGRTGEVEVRERDGGRRFLQTVGRGPTKVVSVEGERVAVACLWDRVVRVLDARSGEEMARHTVSFEPGEMLSLPDGRLMVAGVFGGRFVTLTPGEAGSEHEGRIDAVNIRGLALSGDRSEVLLVHMASGGPTQVTRTNVDWGLILSSKLTAIRVDDLEESRPSVRQLSLDGSGNGSADPSGIVVSEDGNVIYVCLRGAHQVLRIDRRLGGPSGPDLHPLGDSNRLGEAEVGNSPFGIAIDPTGRFLATADAMSDSVSILSASGLEPVATVELNEGTIQRTPAQRGEAVFLDGRRALDRWMSCASCHPGGHRLSLRFDTLGDGSYGDPKDTPSLLGVGRTPPYGWTGRFRTLDEQVEQSMLTSLHGPHPSGGQVRDVVAYLETLKPPPAREEGDPEVWDQGRVLFERRKCDTCHQPPAFSSRPLRNPAVEGFEGLYSTPSLLGVDRTAPYFHDASAETLDEALQRHHPGSDEAPDRDERAALAVFLQSLGA